MTILYSVLIFIFGSLLTSFFHLIALRLPNKESIMGHSYCPHCHHPLRLIDVIPIFGYLINRGKCHFCKMPIPISHLILEVIGGILFIGSYLLLGFQWELMVAFIMISVLMIETISDQTYMIVIDKIWIIALVPLIIFRAIQGEILVYLLSSAVMFSILFIFAWLGKKIYHREAFGGGDVKLYLFIGFVLSIEQAILSLFLASLFGLIFGLIKKTKSGPEIALIPFIFAGVLIAYFFGNSMIEWYINLLGV